MPHFRFIIEGSDFEMPSLRGEGHGFVTGFFTTRRAKAIDMAAAKAQVLERLQEEWKSYAPKLSILDSWPEPRFRFRRVPNKGHVLFDDDEFARYAPASIEAEVSRAPKSAAIWDLASKHVPEGDDD